jgi:hypothetical protein
MTAANQPAFPMPIGYAPNSGVEEWNRAQFGMTIRDYFATKALQGMLAYPGDEGRGSWHSNASEESCARAAYQYADAMLAERNRTP